MKLIHPGACQRARWMAKTIYACKVVLLSDSDQRANTKIQSRGQLSKVERFLRFVMYVYLPWCLTAPVASGEPANDLELINELLTCREVDYAMAKKVMDKLKNQLWYLVEDMAPLSLFSPIVSEDMKDRIVKKMLTYPTTDVTGSVTGYGKPGNPRCLTQLTNTWEGSLGQGVWNSSISLTSTLPFCMNLLLVWSEIRTTTRQGERW